MTDTMGRMHSDAQFAGSSSVKFLFLLCARQNKQVSFPLAYASVPAHAKDDGLPRYRASNVQMSEWKFHLHSQRMQPLLAKGNNPMVGAPKRQGCPTKLGYRS